MTIQQSQKVSRRSKIFSWKLVDTCSSSRASPRCGIRYGRSRLCSTRVFPPITLWSPKRRTGSSTTKFSKLATGKLRTPNWNLGMQSRNGGWGAFDTDNTLDVWNQMPFGDMKAMIDPPTADLTGRLLEMMGTFGYDRDFRRARRALDFLREVQERDGSWWGRWGVNY